MEQVEEICDHIILVNKGQKILDGGVAQVKQEFKENLFHLGLEVIPRDNSSSFFDVIGHRNGGLLVKINEGYKPNDVLRFYIDQNINVTAFNELLPSLNDIFIRLVEGTSVSRQFQTLNS
jgi:ABC-2 type transport system ATP-binding protein